MMKQLFLLLNLILILNCGPSKGEFGWATTFDQDKNILEKEISFITDFKMTRKNLVFSPSDTIHYIYTFDRNPGGSTEFVITLEKESLGFVEIDLKKKFVEPDSTSLRDHFSDLAPGKYRIQIVFDTQVLDNIEFEILAREGYSLKEENSDIQDEIIRYSK